MATKPTRQQQQACDLLAEALSRLTEAARLDGRGPFDRDDLAEAAGRMARASSAFGLDEILTRALEKRTRSLGLRADAVELLTLMDVPMPLPDVLMLDDESLRELVAKLEEELGGL